MSPKGKVPMAPGFRVPMAFKGKVLMAPEGWGADGA